MWRWLGIGLLIVLLGGCSKGPQVQIRIRNQSSQDMTNFWLGAGGTGPTPQSYGAIPAGTTTNYRSMPAVLAYYRKSDFLTADGMRYLTTIYPETFLNVAELAPGSYTFSYDIQNGEAVFELLAD